MAEEAARHPERPVEAFAMDEHRIGLKPLTRRVWAPIGERPIAPGHHRFEWLYVTAFVSPATGATFWYVHSGISKAFFEAPLALFAKEAGAGRDRTIVLELVVAPEKPDRAQVLRLVHGRARIKPDASRLRAARGWRA